MTLHICSSFPLSLKPLEMRNNFAKFFGLEVLFHGTDCNCQAAVVSFQLLDKERAN